MLRAVPWSCVASPEVGFTGSEPASSYYSSGDPGVFGLHMRLYYKNPFIELDPWQTVSPERAAARYGIYGSRLRFPRPGFSSHLEVRGGGGWVMKSALALYVVVLKQAK